MGLDVSVKGLSYDETYHCGYITFGYYRMAVAKAWNEEFGKLYEKPYMDIFFKGYTQEECNRWNEICNDDLDLFLNHSDCEGKISWQDCKKIYNAMKDLKVDNIGHNYGTMSNYDMHNLWLNMFKYCWKHRVNMYFH